MAASHILSFENYGQNNVSTSTPLFKGEDFWHPHALLQLGTFTWSGAWLNGNTTIKTKNPEPNVHQTSHFEFHLIMLLASSRGERVLYIPSTVISNPSGRENDL